MRHGDALLALVLLGGVLGASLVALPRVAHAETTSTGTSTVTAAPAAVEHPFGYVPVNPARVLDTRSAHGVPGTAPLGPDSSIDVVIAGRGGIPASGVAAVVLNVTATAVTRATHVTVHAAGTARPGTSSLNPAPGKTTANLVITQLGTTGDGAISLYNKAGQLHLIADVAGWIPSGSDYGSVAPARVLDTRSQVGVPGTAPVGPGATITVPVAGRGGVPASGVGAVVLNVTATAVTKPTHITVHPAGSARPGTSSLNPAPGATSANTVIATLGADAAGTGAVSLYNHAGTAHLIADVVGWIPLSSDYVALLPARVLDTRSGNGVPGTSPVGPGGIVTLTVTGRGGVPSTGVGAVVLNLTAAQATHRTFVTTYPAGAPRPPTSSLNPSPGGATPNLVVARLNAAGAVSFFNSSGSVHLIADVVGWIPAAAVGVDPVDARPDRTVTVTAGNGMTVQAPSTSVQAPGFLRVDRATATSLTFTAAGFAPHTAFTVGTRVVAGEAHVAAPSGTPVPVASRRTPASGTELTVVLDAPTRVVTWEQAQAETLAESDHADVPDTGAGVEAAEGLGGSLCGKDALEAQVSYRGVVPIEVCVEADSRLIKVMNVSGNWHEVRVSGGQATPTAPQYDGTRGVRRVIDVHIHQTWPKPLSFLPPNSVVNFAVPESYTGDVTFTTYLLRQESLVPNIATRLAGVFGGDSIGLIGAAVGVADITRELSDCLQNDDRWLNDTRCTSGYAWDVAYEFVKYGLAEGDVRLAYKIALELVPFLGDLAKQLGDALAFSGNTVIVRGVNSTVPVQLPEERPVDSQPPPVQSSGELYAGGVRSCAATYVNHPRPAPSGSWSPSVDVNADGGDYGRTLYMPWDGRVTVYSSAASGSGWGNSWIVRRASDGYELFIAHGLETLATGDLAAGAAFGRAGNTGKVIGSADMGGSHLHLNARLNGAPAPIVLGGTLVEPGVCWVTRTGPTSEPSPVTPPPGSSASVQLALGAAAPHGNWYDVTLTGFPANSSIAVQCHDSVDRAFFTAYLMTDGAGNARDTTTCYSNLDGKQVSAGGMTVGVGGTSTVTTEANPNVAPPPDSSVTLAQGAPADFGHWYDVTLRSFAPHTTYAVACHDAVDRGFYTAYLTTDGSGYARDSTTCYSAEGGKQVTADGITAGMGQTVTRSSTGGSTPTPGWTITLRQGAPATYGYWYDVVVTGPAGASITLYCNDSVDQRFWTQTFTTDGAGRAADSTLCMSADGPDHWVSSSVGVDSNHVAW